MSVHSGFSNALAVLLCVNILNQVPLESLRTESAGFNFCYVDMRYSFNFNEHYIQWVVPREIPSGASFQIDIYWQPNSKNS